MSTGAGSSSAGFNRSGFDPIVTGPATRLIGVAAMRYEGSTKDWELDEENNFVGVTPNEQAVVLSMCIKQGSIKSSPTTGNTLHQILYLGSPNLGADITNRVMLSNPIARLVADGSVSISKIAYLTGKMGLRVAVYFADLDTDPNKIIPVHWRQ